MPKQYIIHTMDYPLSEITQAVNSFAKEGYVLHTLDQYEDETWLLIMEKDVTY